MHDDEHSHSILIEELELESIVYPTSETKGLSDKDNPLYPVNNLHLLLKQFIRNHGAYGREHLQDWLNLFWFIMNGIKICRIGSFVTKKSAILRCNELQT